MNHPVLGEFAIQADIPDGPEDPTVALPGPRPFNATWLFNISKISLVESITRITLFSKM